MIFGLPTSTTGASSNVGARAATVSGAVNPNGRETTVSIQYGTTTAYNGGTVQIGSVGNGSSPVVVEAALSNLLPTMTYHYRVVSTNGVGSSNGADAVFTTTNNSSPVARDLIGASTSLTAVVDIVLPPDIDPENDPLTLSIANQPSFGVATTIANGIIRYTPNARLKGLDTFTYSVSDSLNPAVTGTVTIRNPFASLKGTYLTYLTNTAGEPVGSVKMTVGSTGVFSGSLSFGGSFAVKGTFDPITGSRLVSPTITFNRTGKPPLTVTLRINTKSETGVLSGSVNDGTSNAFIDDARLVSTKAAPHAAKYTVWLRPPAEPELPQGNGWATLSISAKGACKMAGKLSDGTAYSTSPTLRTTDSVIINVPLYATQPAIGRGYLFGELGFKDKAGTDVGGGFKWKRGMQPKSLVYPLGFGPEGITVVASRFTPIAVLPGTHRFALTDGGLADNTTNFPVSFIFGVPSSSGVAKTIIASNNVPENVKFTANLKAGTFSGTFVHPDIGAASPRAFSGVIFQKQNTGVGIFLGLTSSGAAEIDLQ